MTTAGRVLTILALSSVVALTGCSATTSVTAPAQSVIPPIVGSAFPIVSQDPSNASQSAPSHNTTHDNTDIKAYMHQLKGLGVTENALLERYGAVTGDNYTDDQTMYDALVGLLPDVQSFLVDIESLVPPTDDISAAQDLWIEGWNKQSLGMTLAISGIQTQDFGVMAKANDALAEGRSLIRQSLRKFKEATSS